MGYKENFEIAKNFNVHDFNNVTDTLTADTNQYFVAAGECHRFVLENCYGTTRFFMITSAGLLILLAVLMIKEGYFNKPIQKVKEWKSQRFKK